jgi:hypothetical protein
MLWMFQRVYYGNVVHEENRNLPDLRPREWAGIVPLCAMALVMGIFPAIFLTPMAPAVATTGEHVQRPQSFRVSLEQDRERRAKGKGQGAGERLQVLGERVQVSGERLQVSGETFQVSGERFQVHVTGYEVRPEPLHP